MPADGMPTEDLKTLLAAAAAELLHNPAKALPLAARAVQLCPSSLQALEQLAEIHVELGDTAAAHELYARAAALDPAGAPERAGGSGPDKFLWLAQLSPAGGAEAVSWYERGAASLRALIAAPPPSSTPPDEHALQAKLVSALCGLAELYLSDLCMEPDAEARCEAYVAEALLVAPASPEALQTLASVRISQQRMPDAVAALDRALAALSGLPASDTPSYATRIALARLLIECARYEPALALLESLQAEHDQLPDLWYLGGWTLFLLGEAEDPAGRAECWDSARDWLRTCEKVTLPLFDCDAMWPTLTVTSYTRPWNGKTRASRSTRPSCWPKSRTLYLRRRVRMRMRMTTVATRTSGRTMTTRTTIWRSPDDILLQLPFGLALPGYTYVYGSTI